MAAYKRESLCNQSVNLQKIIRLQIIDEAAEGLFSLMSFLVCIGILCSRR